MEQDTINKPLLSTKKGVSFVNTATRIDWKLLLFLALFLDVKLVVKVAAIFIIYIQQPDFKFGFKLKDSRLPLFYLFILIIALIDWLLYKGYNNRNYSVVFFTGTGYWLLCILAIHQVKLCVEKNDISVVHNTITAFFILNAFVSLLTFLPILWEIREINPYRYQGEYQKYFISTGDYIRGITFDVSTTNAILNAFGVIYFLVRKRIPMLLLCMSVLLFTGSNFTNLILLLTFVYLFIFKTDRDQKSMLIVCTVLLIVFMAKISPQNNVYAFATVRRIFIKDQYDHHPLSTGLLVPVTQKPDNQLTPEEKRKKIAELYLDSLRGVIHKKEVAATNANPYNQVWKVPFMDANPDNRVLKVSFMNGKPVIPGDSIHTATFQSKKDESMGQKELISFAHTQQDGLTDVQREYATTRLPGKAIALKQSILFFRDHPFKIFTGAGMGNFSSKLAFRATGLKLAGGYPGKFIYINKNFLNNHLGLYLYFFSKNSEYHSLTNNPASVYDQLFCEYGVVGFLVFAVFYGGFFLKHRKNITYGIPLLILLIGSFAVEYWFEQLSIVIFFELLLLLDIKETGDPQLAGQQTGDYGSEHQQKGDPQNGYCQIGNYQTSDPQTSDQQNKDHQTGHSQGELSSNGFLLNGKSK